MTTEELKVFLKEKIDYLTNERDKYEEQEEWSMYDYLAGCIDAYDIVQMQLTE